MTGQRIVIQPLGFDSPTEIAAQELAKYLPRMAKVTVEVLPAREAMPQGVSADICLGSSIHLMHAVERHAVRHLPYPLGEDAYEIASHEGVLYLIGNRPRSVLFAAYRLLEELGCVFLRPGPGGEIIPKLKSLEFPTKPIRETASYHHRGICIEGAPRLEHVLDLLDWMAKKKMNVFQLQFEYGEVFWKRGYRTSPEIAPTEPSDDFFSAYDSLTLDDRVIAKLKSLDMMVHRVGHGWTAEVFGMKGLDWTPTRLRPKKALQHRIALVKGKRVLFEGKPSQTDLCYSQAEVREAFIDIVLRYARQHSEVDYLHVWLSDAYSQKCECAACRKKSPTDWYVELMEVLGRRMKEEGLRMRIVFLAYVDLLWPPDKARITVDNVTLMFAPITRCFQHALTDPKCDDNETTERPPLNSLYLPRRNKANAEIMRSWEKLGIEDTFIFDYHNAGAGLLDGLGADVGAITARDMRDLQDLGIGGMMSCQVVRGFLPTPYLMNAMADVLWNRKLALKPHRQAVMEAAFGKHAGEAEDYLAQLVRAHPRGGQVWPQARHRQGRRHARAVDGARGVHHRARDAVCEARAERRRTKCRGPASTSSPCTPSTGGHWRECGWRE